MLFISRSNQPNPFLPLFEKVDSKQTGEIPPGGEIKKKLTTAEWAEETIIMMTNFSEEKKCQLYSDFLNRGGHSLSTTTEALELLFGLTAEALAVESTPAFNPMVWVEEMLSLTSPSQMSPAQCQQIKSEFVDRGGDRLTTKEEVVSLFDEIFLKVIFPDAGKKIDLKAILAEEDRAARSGIPGATMLNGCVSADAASVTVTAGIEIDGVTEIISEKTTYRSDQQPKETPNTAMAQAMAVAGVPKVRTRTKK